MMSKREILRQLVNKRIMISEVRGGFGYKVKEMNSSQCITAVGEDIITVEAYDLGQWESKNHYSIHHIVDIETGNGGSIIGKGK